MLLDYYISMGDPKKHSSPDSDIPYECAFNFPAVLVTMGKGVWPKLRDLYVNLAHDSRLKVRRTLSFSIHEIAKILGSELTQEELLPILIHFLKDTLEVKEGVLSNLPQFISVLEL
jgi:serine/threonine-protein phosphatase 4 regulatory subunit 1